jgi:hypothetical protein
MRDKIDIEVKTRVSLTDHKYTYSYSLSNGPAAEQSIWQFWLPLPDRVSIEGLRSPSRWLSAYHTDKRHLVKWGTHTSEISPRSTQGGFSFSSESPPGIVEFYAEGWAPSPWFPEGFATDSIPGYSDRTPYGPGLMGVTIGPTNLWGLAATATLDTMLRYIGQMPTLGWLKDPRSGDKYIACLTKARETIAQCDTLSTLAILREATKKVQLDSSVALSYEAYIILRHDAEFLCHRLERGQ